MLGPVRLLEHRKLLERVRVRLDGVVERLDQPRSLAPAARVRHHQLEQRDRRDGAADVVVLARQAASRRPARRQRTTSDHCAIERHRGQGRVARVRLPTRRQLLAKEGSRRSAQRAHREPLRPVVCRCTRRCQDDVALVDAARVLVRDVEPRLHLRVAPRHEAGALGVEADLAEGLGRHAARLRGLEGIGDLDGRRLLLPHVEVVHGRGRLQALAGQPPVAPRESSVAVDDEVRRHLDRRALGARPREGRGAQGPERARLHGDEMVQRATNEAEL